MKKLNLYPLFTLVMMLFCSITTFAQRPPNGPGGPDRDIRINNRDVRHTPRGMVDSVRCAALNFRSIDGTCNNVTRLSRMEFGATDVEMIRVVLLMDWRIM